MSNKITSLFTFLFILFIQGINYVQAQSYTIKPIFTSETELVPNTGLTGYLSSPDSFYIANNGDILFITSLSDGTQGLYLYSNGKLELLVKTVIAQSLNTKEFLAIGDADINDIGEVVFYGNLSGKNGIYKIKILENVVLPLVIAGDRVSGLEGTTIEDLKGILSINNKGEIVVLVTLSDGRRGFFLFKDNRIEPFLLAGDKFPVSNGNESMLLPSLPVINDKSEIVFRGAFYTDIDKEFAEQGIFFFREGEFIPVKLGGQIVPGTGGKVFAPSQFTSIALNNNSQIVYAANFLNFDEDGTLLRGDDDGVFLWSEGETIPLVLPGENTPGTNEVFDEQDIILMKDAINDFGDTAAVLYYDTDKASIFLIADKKIIPVLLDEYPPPIKRFFRSLAATINNDGNIIFSAGTIAPISLGLYMAIKEDTSFEVLKIEPQKSGKHRSLYLLDVLGTGFQPGAKVSFNEKGIHVLKTKFNTSMNLTITIRITPIAKPGLYDVVVINPVGGEAILSDGFEVVDKR